MLGDGKPSSVLLGIARPDAVGFSERPFRHFAYPDHLWAYMPIALGFHLPPRTSNTLDGPRLSGVSYPHSFYAYLPWINPGVPLLIRVSQRVLT